LKAKGATDRYIRETQSRILHVCTECKFHRLADMNASVLIRWLNKQGVAGMGARTQNSYREVMLTFCNWAVSDNSLAYNPFCRVPKAKESIDKRHERRALTPREVEMLSQAAEERPLHDITQFIENTHKKITSASINKESENAAKALGLERKLLYATLIYTGLWKGELASITTGQVFLDAKIPHIVLAAKDEKSRRGSTLPLHPELVSHLKGWLKQRGKVSPQEKLFFVSNALHRILDRDLKFAGIAKRDSLNRVIDVHALRHTHATLLAQNGVSPSVAKSAMRHSDIRLTMNVYSHLELGDVAEGVNRLPNFLGKKNDEENEK
jgi:integrase